MAFRWLEERRIHKQSARLRELFAAGDLVGALVHFETVLLPYGRRVDPSLRALGHLQRWLVSPNDRDVLELRELAAAGKGTTIAAAFRAVQRLDAVRRLTAALHARDTTALPRLGVLRDSAQTEDAALSRLGLALLESRVGAEGVLDSLPFSPPPPFRAAHAHLRLWALIEREQYEEAATDERALRTLETDQARSVRWAAALGWARQAVARADLDGARAALESVAGDDGHATVLADALAHLGCGRHAVGRALLARIDDDPARYLAALSFFASAREWPAAAGGEADRELRVKNRALWRTVRGELDPLLARLRESAEPWRGDLLAGLVAYVDAGAALDLELIRRFAAAAERAGSPFARTRLRNIQAALTSRALATEEAVSLMRAGRTAELRDLAQTVLESAGESIPPLVRAAVHLTLWRDDPSYDPLPALRRIAAAPDEEELIAQCIREVRIGQAVRQLTDGCFGSSDVMPPTDALTGADGDLASLGALAAAILHARRGELEVARRLLPAGDGDPLLAQIRFHVAWRERDAAVCLELTPWIDDPRAWLAVPLLAVMRIAEGAQGGPVWELLERVAALDGRHAGAVSVLESLLVWLLDHDQGAAAQTLLRKVQEETGREDIAHFEPFVAARLGRYTAYIDAVDRLEPWNGNEQLAATCRLLRIEAELALAAQAGDDVALRWRSIQRTLDERADDLSQFAPLRPYVWLLRGLFAFLATDTWVDDATIERLAAAHRFLPLERHVPFLENAVGKRRWRQRVIEAFWNGLRAGDLKQSRLIYYEELKPAFAERMPPTIELGMVLADWGAGVATTEELLRRLDAVVEEAPQLGGALADEARGYIRDGDQLRRVTKMLQEHQYERLLDEASAFTWSGLPAGSMPVPVAIAELLACFKLKKEEVVEGFAAEIAGDRELAMWARDDGALLLGYVRFDKGDYPNAAAAFETISSAKLLGHDVDHYAAAAHFRNGVALLKVDQKDKAFDTFCNALQRSEEAVSTLALAPLFLHFGLKAIESNDGRRARNAFELLSVTLDREKEPSTDIAINRFLARMGLLLCRVLLDEAVSRDAITELLEEVQTNPRLDDVEPLRVRFIRTLWIFSICSGLRRRNRKHLSKELEELEKLEPKAKQRDPLVRLLRALIDVVVEQKKSTPEALQALEDALRLGLRSSRLAELLQKQRTLMKELVERSKGALDLIDAYLTSGLAHPGLAADLARDDELAELYRVHRGYEPADIVADPAAGGVKAFLSRLERLAVFAEEAKHDQYLLKIAEEVRSEVKKLSGAEKKLQELEQKFIRGVATSLKTELRP